MNNKLAKEVLVKAREQMISEIAKCGSHGGIGRAQSYAPVLVSINESIKIIEGLEMSTAQAASTVADRMAAVRAAKTVVPNTTKE